MWTVVETSSTLRWKINSRFIKVQETFAIRSDMFVIVHIRFYCTTRRVGLSSHGFISRLCRIGPDLQDNRVIPDGQMTSWSIHAPAGKSCRVSIARQGIDLISLRGHTHQVKVSPSNFWFLLGETLAWQNCRCLIMAAQSAKLDQFTAASFRQPRVSSSGICSVLEPGWKSDQDLTMLQKKLFLTV